MTSAPAVASDVLDSPASLIALGIACLSGLMLVLVIDSTLVFRIGRRLRKSRVGATENEIGDLARTLHGTSRVPGLLALAGIGLMFSAVLYGSRNVFAAEHSIMATAFDVATDTKRALLSRLQEISRDLNREKTVNTSGFTVELVEDSADIRADQSIKVSIQVTLRPTKDYDPSFRGPRSYQLEYGRLFDENEGKPGIQSEVHPKVSIAMEDLVYVRLDENKNSDKGHIEIAEPQQLISTGVGTVIVRITEKFVTGPTDTPNNDVFIKLEYVLDGIERFTSPSGTTRGLPVSLFYAQPTDYGALSIPNWSLNLKFEHPLREGVQFVGGLVGERRDSRFNLSSDVPAGFERSPLENGISLKTNTDFTSPIVVYFEQSVLDPKVQNELFSPYIPF